MAKKKTVKGKSNAKASTGAKAKSASKPARAAQSKASSATKTVMPMAKVTPADTPRTKGEIFTILAETTGLSRRDVRSLFESMSDMVAKDLSKKGCGFFTVPGLMKIRRVQKAAVPARKGVNPFTGQEQTFKAKPARNVVKVRPMKALKDMV